MANPEHLALVRKGAKAIAKWREAHPGERLDLSGADLGLARLCDAHLSGANLTGANLTGADFRSADVRGANLSETDLHEAYLSGTHLNKAHLSQAELADTALGNLDLSQVIGLASVKHDSPSSVGTDTLVASFRGAGNKLTPELATFFRGAGVPQGLLDALHKIVLGIEYYSCFVAYGKPDLEFAKSLRADLNERGVDCWFYPHDKTVGENTQREIAAARRRAEKVIVVCSVAGLMRDGLLKEIEDQAEEDAEKLMPVSLDLLWREPNFRVARGGQDLKPFLLLKNYGYFASWDSDPERYQKGLDDLLKGLRRPKATKATRSRKSS